MLGSAEIVKQAWKIGLTVPSFNVPHLPMVEPLVRAARDTDSFALIAVSRIDWMKFEAKGVRPMAEEFSKHADESHVRLHLDHVPVIDEDHLDVDYVTTIKEALAAGYQSVMVDASRLDLKGNIAATREIVKLAHTAGVPCEAELGAVLGHEAGPLPPYEELFRSGRGFTDVEEARRFVKETRCDWLSVAVGNIHGAVSDALRDQKKPEARLDLEHLEKLSRAAGVPLVLHGGSGVRRDSVLGAVKRGIAKVNVGTEIRQAYEAGLKDGGSIAKGQEAVYERTVSLIRDYFGLEGTRKTLFGEG
ncbi:MAG: class II fructose-bisphosphate aldolase [Planctomycetota bacterium]